MSKRRGVVISMNQAPSIGKSKSANFNPQPYQLQNHPLAYQIEPEGHQSGEIEPMADEEMIESNFISEDPPREVNLKHYAYRDPDYMYDDIEDKYQENDEDVIESMYKKKELIQARKKQEHIKKIAAKRQVPNPIASREKRPNRNKQVQTHHMSRPIANKNQHANKYKPKNTGSRQKQSRQNPCHLEPTITQNQKVLKRSIDTEILKPKPLDFRVDMFDRKAMYSPHKRKRDDFSSNYRAYERNQTQNISQQSYSQNNKDSEGETTVGVNENINSRKLPFRLCAFP